MGGSVSSMGCHHVEFSTMCKCLCVCVLKHAHRCGTQVDLTMTVEMKGSPGIEPARTLQDEGCS